MVLKVEPVKCMRGAFRPPSDKSLTHRAYMLGAIASEESVVRKPLEGEDCESTLSCLTQMGLRSERGSGEVKMMPA
ncbi:MAG TPA: hypothetical protein VMI31_14985, partial [Fimbriimonadaceae bacterium]|nr:hypothetical protein [Fimbriimonadaceae bacterium]